MEALAGVDGGTQHNLVEQLVVYIAESANILDTLCDSRRCPDLVKLSAESPTKALYYCHF
jgi:hypothetical protein